MGSAEKRGSGYWGSHAPVFLTTPSDTFHLCPQSCTVLPLRSVHPNGVPGADLGLTPNTPQDHTSCVFPHCPVLEEPWFREG